MTDAAVSDSREATIRRLFHVGLWLKAAHSLVEIVGGLVLYLVSDETIRRFADTLTSHELLEDPRDLVANFVMRSTEQLSGGARHAAALYLLSHGVIKLFLVLMVLRGYRWAYPAFMIALTVLIVYQSYRIALTASPWLIALTVFDLAVLWLTWHEWRFQRRAPVHVNA
jgi:uncharacterized membrane protein